MGPVAWRPCGVRSISEPYIMNPGHGLAGNGLSEGEGLSEGDG